MSTISKRLDKQSIRINPPLPPSLWPDMLAEVAWINFEYMRLEQCKRILNVIFIDFIPLPRPRDGGRFASTIRLSAAALKPHKLGSPNFDFLVFAFWPHHDRILAKSVHQWVSAVIFLKREVTQKY